MMSTSTLAVPSKSASDSGRRFGWTVFALAPLVLGPVWVATTRLLGDHPLATVSGGLLVMLLTVSFVTDARHRVIPNFATYSTFVWALVINALAEIPQTTIDASWLGAVGFESSLAGGLGLLAIMLAIFSLTGGGAGDVKLVACLGALLGWQRGIDATLFGFIIGGISVVAYSIWKSGPLFLLQSILQSLASLLLPGKVSPPSSAARGLLTQRLPLAPFFAAGALLAVFQHPLLEMLGR